MSFSEAELQAWLESAVEGETLVDAIDASVLKETTNAAAFEASFGPDFLLRSKLLGAARLVMSSLHGAEIVSHSRNNISMTKGERLFPDLVLVDRESARLILVEVKRGSQTAREALTELAAYEQEVRNALPYASDLDILYVVVSTDFPTLLDHGIAGMVMWGSKQVLCLRVTETKAPFRMAVRLPSSWSPMAQGILPPDAAVMQTLVLYDAPEGADVAAAQAIDFIAREGDRKNAHGFALAWRRFDVNDPSRDTIFISVAAVNPFSFLRFAVEKGILRDVDTTLAAFLASNADDLATASSTAMDIAHPAVEWLSRRMRPMWESSFSWPGFRRPPSEAGPWSFRFTAEPLATEFWGALGDFARQRTVAGAGSWKYWENGVKLLDEVFGVRRLVPRPDARLLFELGATLGSLLWLIEGNPDEAAQRFRRPPLLWCIADVSAVFPELIAHARRSIASSAPRLRVSLNDIDATRASILAVIDWIVKTYTGPSYPFHQCLFVNGLNGSAYLQRYVPREYAGAEALGEAVPHLVSGTRALLELLRLDAGARAKVDAFGTMDEAAILSLADADALIELVDDVAMPIPLRDDPMPATGIDWETLRQQFEKLRKQSASEPVLVIEASGEVSVAPRPEELPLQATQDGEVVVVWHTPEGLEVVRVDRWEALKERPTLVPY